MKYNATDELGEITRRRGVAYYHQLYTLLATALTDGVITPGSALPSETELMQRFQVSRNTVRRAFARLEQEKRIIRRRGSGTYARNVPQGPGSAAAIAEALRTSDDTEFQTSTKLLRVKTGPTPEFIRRREPEFSAQSMVVHRSRSFRNTPFLLSISHVPEALAARLTRRLLERQAVISALAAGGVVAKTAEQVTTAQPADSFVARHLGLELSAPVLCVQRLIRDGGGQPIEHQSHLFHPDRCQLHDLLVIENAPQGLRWLDTQPRRFPRWLD
jgi:GntR family transcriptional regulator